MYQRGKHKGEVEKRDDNLTRKRLHLAAGGFSSNIRRRKKGLNKAGRPHLIAVKSGTEKKERIAFKGQFKGGEHSSASSGGNNPLKSELIEKAWNFATTMKRIKGKESEGEVLKQSL